jgi:hypothetical protein
MGLASSRLGLAAAAMTVGMVCAACVPPRATTPLTMAAAGGDVLEIERLIGAGADPNGGAGAAFTPLIWAARKGEVAAVRRLVALGANPNLTSGVNDFSPLEHALHARQTAAALALIELGATVTGARQPRTLAMTAGYGNAEVMRALLARGVDPHTPLGGGPSLLALAAAGGYDIERPWSGCQHHTATVRVLVTHAPDLRLDDTLWDRYAMDYIKRHECEAMVTLLATRAPATRASR